MEQEMTEHTSTGDLFSPALELSAVNAISSLGLAHIGDAVYEILVRTMLIGDGLSTGAHLHHDTTQLVCAPAQAQAADKLLPQLFCNMRSKGRQKHRKGTQSLFIDSAFLLGQLDQLVVVLHEAGNNCI